MIKYIFTFILGATLLFFIVKDRIYLNDTILLGASIPKTGLMKEWGKSVEYGTNAYFKYVNEKNLLPEKRKIRLITLDDKYEPGITLENTKKFLARGDLFSLYGYVGTPTVKNILPLLEKNNIPFIAPFTGASFLRYKENKNFVNFRSSYKEEIEKIVDYLYLKKDIRKFAIFYQNDQYGEEGYVSLLKSLEKRGLKLQGEGTYKRNTLSIKHAFSELANTQPEALIMIGAYKANALFIKRAKENKNLKDTIFSTISFSNAEVMIKDLDFNAKNLIFSEVVPNYDDSKIDVIKEYKYLMRRYYPKESLGFISLESFLAAKTIVKAISNIKGFLTQEKLLKELKLLPKDTLDGMQLEYKNTQLLNKVYLFKYKDSGFEEIND